MRPNERVTVPPSTRHGHRDTYHGDDQENAGQLVLGCRRRLAAASSQYQRRPAPESAQSREGSDLWGREG